MAGLYDIDDVKWYWRYPSDSDKVFRLEWIFDGSGWDREYNETRCVVESFTIDIKILAITETGERKWTDGVTGTVTPSDFDRKMNRKDWYYEWTPPANARIIKMNIGAKSKTYSIEGGSASYFGDRWWFQGETNISASKPPKLTNIDVYRDDNKSMRIYGAVRGIYDDDVANSDIKFVEFQLLQFPSHEAYNLAKVKYVVTSNESEFNVYLQEDGNQIVTVQRVAVNSFGGAMVNFEMKPGLYYTIRGRYVSVADGSENIGVWSPIAETLIKSSPTKPEITNCYYATDANVKLDWNGKGQTDVTYTIDVAQNQREFAILDTWLNENPNATQEDIDKFCKDQRSGAITRITGIHTSELVINTKGQRAFFRVMAVSSEDDKVRSPYSDIASIEPSAESIPPTIWMEDNVAYIGIDDTITIYFAHRSAFGGKAKYGQIQWKFKKKDHSEDINWILTDDWIVPGDPPGESNYTNLFVRQFPLSDKVERECDIYVRAVVEPEFKAGWDENDISEVLTIHVYNKPTIEVLINNSIKDLNGNYIIEHFPIEYTASVSTGSSAHVIGYQVDLTVMESVRVPNTDGSIITLSEGTIVYSNWISKALDGESSDYPYEGQILPQDVYLANGGKYKLKVTASISRGITCETEVIFVANVKNTEHNIVYDYLFDSNQLALSIKAFAGSRTVDEDGVYDVADDKVLMSIYRRNDDGSMVAIAENLGNYIDLYSLDPHPSLKDAYYRLVAIDLDTNNRTFYDVPPYHVGCSDIVIQWDETYEAPMGLIERKTSAEPITGQMLRLRYNIDVTESSDLETNMIKYIGHKDPVSYYGTQTGYTATWHTVIPKSDIETIRMLRKLQVYPGNVYVREPSGTGYWAHLKVTFPINHRTPVVDVTIDLTRVEGGM